MSDPPPTSRLRFRWSWRPYQARLLDAVERHLRDGRLHVVAAPGAGKTTLGLEVFRRLGRPALVLAPTLTIRDQWLRRLRDFLPPAEGGAPADPVPWTSVDLADPAFLTVTTYQAVLARSRAQERGAASEGVEAGAGRDRGAPSGVEAGPGEGDPPRVEQGLEAASSSTWEEDPVEEASEEPPPSDAEADSLVATLRAAGVGTLVLDEAHHLKQAWWRALARVVDGLDDVTLLSLTGTPPYDATGLEWRRYEELCGPIDDEISVPELVRAGTLCPHQDFVYAVRARDDETARVRAHGDAVDAVLRGLIEDPRFEAEVDAHPWLSEDGLAVDAVLERPELAVALLTYLRATGSALPPPLLDTLALSAGELPVLGVRWWQVLLEAYVVEGSFGVDGAYRSELAARLREDGLLWRRSLRLVRSPSAEQALSLSAAKVEGCVAVHLAERDARGDALRQVVLTDYIRPETLRTGVRAPRPDLGAAPVFAALVRAARDRGAGGEDVALLTGSLVVTHATRVEEIRARVGAGLRTAPLPERDGWMRLDGVGSGALVGALTRLLGTGRVRTIVGTRGLLGEGWDAPAVNSLVLASFVGATVGTNQMRGRAIRKDPGAPDKVASVWHLVSVAPDAPSGLLDVDALEERFRTFVGLSATGTVIESGLPRLDLPSLGSGADLEAFNAESVRRLGALDRVADGWRRAIDASDIGQVVPTVSFRRPPTLRPLQLTRTLRYALYEAGFASIAAAGEVVRRLATSGGGSGEVGLTLLAAAAVPMLIVSPKLFRAARLALLHAPVDGSVAQIGRALLEALLEVGLVAPSQGLRVRTGRLERGGVHVSLQGASFYEQSLFADALGEVLGPVERPRYLVTRPLTDLFGRRVDYHAVPSVLGARRELADAFHAAWLRHVGVGELIYTRGEGGREILLAARARAFSNQFTDPAERLDRWQ